MEAGGGNADDRVAGRDQLAGDDRVERDEADCAARQLEAVDDVADLGDLATGDLDPGELGAPAQALADRIADLGVGGLAEDEVDEGDRLGADADQVVDVHRDAVDADRLESTELLGDHHLGPDAVGAEGDPGVLVDPQNAGVATRQIDYAGGLAGLDLRKMGDERGHGGVRVALADPGLGVGTLYVFAHRCG